jgi:hypothetical protein
MFFPQQLLEGLGWVLFFRLALVIDRQCRMQWLGRPLKMRLEMQECTVRTLLALRLSLPFLAIACSLLAPAFLLSTHDYQRPVCELQVY